MASRLSGRAKWTVIGLVLASGAAVLAGIIPATMLDFWLPGTQSGVLSTSIINTSGHCVTCHGDHDPGKDPGSTWKGSLKALSGYNPLFFAQMTTANQDVDNAGYYCMRCHIPMSFVTGHAEQPDGSTLSSKDRDGINCHTCHSMADPVYRPGVSPAEDEMVLAMLPGGPPPFYGNAMFVLDDYGTRRGPRGSVEAPHEVLPSPFHRSANFCGTCHDVGNVVISRQPNGTYQYNAIDAPAPSMNPAHQFPLQRTFSEWKLSAFAAGGVDMGGRFGGTRGTVISECQDCHMPGVATRAAAMGPDRPDVARHSFAGGAAQVLDLIAAATVNEQGIDQAAIVRGRANSVSMLERAATMVITQDGPSLNVRVVNETGHKLPTGHAEGRRIWINARFLDAAGGVVAEFGRYNAATATLDAAGTTVFEIDLGLSPEAATATRLPPGSTMHVLLADTIEKDNRIPPRGFSNAAYEVAGAPVVDATYADGQHWADTAFAVPAGAVRAEAVLYYQCTPREYIEELRNMNTTDTRGQELYNLWTATGRGEPIAMVSGAIDLGPLCNADYNDDGGADNADVTDLANDIASGTQSYPPHNPDFNNDGGADNSDVTDLANTVASGQCP